MKGIGTDRELSILLEQHDLHLILIIALSDLLLTIYGISSGAGFEKNPFYAPLTSSLGGMIFGLVFYLGILLVMSYFLAGDIRNILASIVFGMHVAGTLSWVENIIPLAGSILNIFWFLLGGTGGTALFYWYFARNEKNNENSNQT